MDCGLPNGAYYTAGGRRNDPGAANSPSLHYVGLTPEVSSMSAPGSWSASAAPADGSSWAERLTHIAGASPLPAFTDTHEELNLQCSLGLSLARAAQILPADTEPAALANGSITDEGNGWDGAVAPEELKSPEPQGCDEVGGTSVHESPPARNKVYDSAHDGVHEEDDGVRSADDSHFDGEEDSRFGTSFSSGQSGSSGLPMLMYDAAEYENVVDVLRSRIHALGTAILHITETALTDTGASLEDSLRREHKIGRKKQRRKPARPAGTDRARVTPFRPSQSGAATSRGGALSTGKSKPPTWSSSGAPRLQSEKRPDTARGGPTTRMSRPSPAASALLDLEGSSAPKNLPSRKSRPRRAVAVPLDFDDAVASPTQEECPASGALSAPAYVFHVASPEDVLPRLAAAPRLGRYDELLARSKSAAAGAGEEEAAAGTSYTFADRSPLYDASARACALTAAAADWPEMRSRETGDDGVGLDEVLTNSGAVGSAPVATLSGANTWTSFGPSLLAARVLTADESAYAAARLAQGDESRAASQAARANGSSNGPAPGDVLSAEPGAYQVLYVHRNPWQTLHHPAPADSNDAAAFDSEVTPCFSLTDGVSNLYAPPLTGGDGEPISSYHRALFTSLSLGSAPHPGPIRTTPPPVAAEIALDRINNRVADYVQGSLSGISLSAVSSRTNRSPDQDDISPPPPSATAGSRSASLASEAPPAIDSRVRRLRTWQQRPVRGPAAAAGAATKRPRSLFSMSRPRTGVAGAHFYYYTPVPTEAPPYGFLGHAAAAEMEEHTRVVGGGDRRGASTRSDAAFIDVLLTSPAPTRATSPAATYSSSAAPLGVESLTPRCLSPAPSPCFADPAAPSPHAVTAPATPLPAAHPQFLEVVVASDYDPVEWIHAGAARRTEQQHRQQQWAASPLSAADCTPRGTADMADGDDSGRHSMVSITAPADHSTTSLATHAELSIGSSFAFPARRRGRPTAVMVNLSQGVR